MPSPIDTLYAEQLALRTFLQEKGEVSHLSSLIPLHSKTLLLAAASYFESTIVEHVEEFARTRAVAGDDALVHLVRRKAIDRQYHTYFAWDGKNANQFFSLFGPTLGESMKAEVTSSPDLKTSVEKFLELGNQRNELVHENFVTFLLEKTPEEVYSLYKEATRFVDWVGTKLNTK